LRKPSLLQGFVPRTQEQGQKRLEILGIPGKKRTVETNETLQQGTACNHFELRIPAALPFAICGANSLHNGVPEFAIGDQDGLVTLLGAHRWVLNCVFHQFFDLTFDLTPVAEIEIAGFELVRAGLTVAGERDDVFALLKGTVAGDVNDLLAFRREKLAKGKLVLSFVDASQPVFDHSLDHATPIAYVARFPGPVL
jgi:hypothetical protein